MTEVTVYGVTDGCLYCDRVKEDLASAGLPFNFVDVLTNDAAADLFMTEGFESFPLVYIDGVHVGGAVETRDWIKANKG